MPPCPRTQRQPIGKDPKTGKQLYRTIKCPMCNGTGWRDK